MKSLEKISISFQPMCHVVNVNPGVYNDLKWLICEVDFNERAVLWLREGCCELETPGSVIKVSKGNLLLFEPAEILRLIATGSLSGYLIRYCPDIIKSLSIFQGLNVVTIKPLFFGTKVIKVTKTTQQHLLQVMEFTERQPVSQQSIEAEILKQYYRLFFLHVYRCLPQSDLFKRPLRAEALTEAFLKTVEQYFRTKRMVKDYAATVSVSSKHLNDVVKKTTGYSAGYHIRQRIALEARHEATTMGSSMKKIAYELGFYDLAHFSKFFKKATGLNFSSLCKDSLN